jgi:hypothetical protein
MNAQPLPATPNLAANLGIILRDLAAIIARRLLRHPLHAILIIPLCQHIARTTRRLENLLARLAAGPLPPPRPRVNPHSGPRHKSPFPAKSAWLVGILGHEAAACASRLEALLAGPAAAELLACTAGRRALAPIRRMLGLTPRCPRRPARPASPAPAGPPPVPPHRSLDEPLTGPSRPWWLPPPRLRSG